MAETDQAHPELAPFPREPIDRLVGPFARFLHVEASSGIVLLLTTLIALVLANSDLADRFLALWKTRVDVGFGRFQLSHSLKHWINDGLMAVFFFLVGLEVKRELVMGELKDLRQATLPIAAALGGMLVPASVYLFLQYGERAQSGWGIPMATDIAFVVGCIAVLGSRVPQSLRVMLLSLAIADDIGAILVIAIGYTEALDLRALGLGIAGVVFMMGLIRLGVRSPAMYGTVGVAVWLGFHESGVHATIAGVILGLITPASARLPEGFLPDTLQRVGRFVHGEPWRSRQTRRAVARHVETAARASLSPLERIETALHPWVSFVIMPLFALANAGVVVTPSGLGDPVAIAVMCGLVVGKPVGIFLFSWLAISAGVARLPAGVSWGALAASGLLAGIGFTMSLFIGGLALQGSALEAAKVGILAASLIAAVFGMGLLVVLLPSGVRRPQAA